MADNMGDNQGAICKKQRMDKLIAQSDYMVVIQDGKKSHEDDKVMLTSKQSWTIAEDQQLLQLVEHYGPQWTRIAQYFPTRDRKRCRERYVNHVDPTLLHTKWSNDEEKQVQKLYQQFGTKWTCIASHMIGRSPDEVKNHILAISLRKKRLESMQKINSCNDRQLPKKWSTNESKLLQQLVATHGAKNWLFIASHIENRTDLQCMQRWYRVLNPSLVKGRGSWTSAEDEILQHKVTQLGKKWSMIASFLPGRSGKQCRERYLNHFEAKLKRLPWTRNEEILLMQVYTTCSARWSEMAKELPGRSENDIKNYWYRLMRREISSNTSSISDS